MDDQHQVQQKIKDAETWMNLYPDYYQNRYPVKYLYNLYYYVKQDKQEYNPFQREMTYEYSNYTGNKSVNRYIIYPNWQSWKKDLELPPKEQYPNRILKLKFDIGPLYSQNMELRKSYNIKPIEREIVFDLDSDDFARVRGCGCLDSQMCQKCWRFMECACCIIQLFCSAFGYKQYFFDFSGRRGMHGWICDKSARTLGQKERETQLKYYNIVTDGDQNIEVKFDKDCLNHQEILIVCNRFFQIMRHEQNWDSNELQNIQKERKLLEYFISKDYKGFWNKFDNRKQHIYEFLWEYCKKEDTDQFPRTVDEFDSYVQKVNKKDKRQERDAIFEGLCKYIIYKTYPRFDINVTSIMNHLLKLPFSIHSKSLWISLPFDHVKVVKKYNLQDTIEQQTHYQNSPGQFEFIKPENWEQFQLNQYSQDCIGIKNIQNDITPEIMYFKSIVENILNCPQDDSFNE